jgi:hypothetical protein
MTIYHRHLDHDWQAARRETNFALFGNSRGEMVASDNNWGNRLEQNAAYYALWRRNLRRLKLNQCADATGREYALAWLRYTEDA